MADRELRSLKRRDLLQMLLAQCEETERLQNELDKRTVELENLQEAYERLKDKLNIKDERLNQKDSKIAELEDFIEEIQSSKVIELEEAGSIAEAALRLNGIFEAAQRCAEQYLTNVRRISQNEPDREDEFIMPDRLAVPEQRIASGQRISYESGWGPVSRRKKLHG